jgi:hypothetical protein
MVNAGKVLGFHLKLQIVISAKRLITLPVKHLCKAFAD